MDHHHIEPLESPREYFKFAGILAAIIGLSLVLSMLRDGGAALFLSNFMAVFFLVFGLFKLLQLEMFVIAYRGYDIVAKRFKVWGYAFPFVELALGFSYLFFGNQLWLNILTLIITFTASIGVFKEVRRKSIMKCACLGTLIRLPLSKVSLVEDVAMFVMAGIMVVL